MSQKSSVLFVSWTTRTSRPHYDVSVRYRCFHPAAGLQARGYKAQVIAQETLQKDTSIADEYDRLVFHRPYLTPEIVEFLDEVTRSKAAIVDFDDLIFDVARAEWTSMVRSRGAAPAGIRNYLSRNAAAASLFSLATASTTPLEKRGAELLPKARFVTVHNALSRAHIGICRLARRESQARRKPYKFGYFSGTATHDSDFAIVAPLLKRELERSPRSRMLIVGPVTLSPELESVKGQIDRRDLVSFARLPWHIAEVENVLAPLEDSPFNECKSGLKFFEAATVGCRVIASPIPDIDRFESELLVKCETESDWQEAISRSFDMTDAQINSEAERVAELCSIDRELDVFCNHVGI